LHFAAVTHISKLYCTDMARDRPGQPANKLLKLLKLLVNITVNRNKSCNQFLRDSAVIQTARSKLLKF